MPINIYRVGYFIGSHPILLLLITVLLTVPILSFFVLNQIIIETDIRRGFAKKDGPSTREFERFGEFYNTSMEDMEIMIVILESKDGAGIPLKMSQQLTDEVERLDTFISSLSTESDQFGLISYKDFETARGNVNYLFHAFKWAYDVQNSYLPSPDDSSIVLSYPKAYIYGHEVFLAGHFVGTHLNHNFRKEGSPTALEAVDAIALYYMIEAHGYREKKNLEQWEMKLLRISGERNFSTIFDFHLFGDQVANSEMERGNARAIYLLAAGIAIMICYMAYVLKTSSRINKIILITSAISSPLLATIVAFAAVGWLRVPFNPIMSLTPALVLGIGVDDAFMLVHSWRRHRPESNLAVRMAAVISEIGPSISITSITNAIAFGIGVLSPAPMMSTFCIFTAIAVALDFVFILTVFAPALSICSRWENPCDRLHSQDDLYKPQNRESHWYRYAQFVVSTSGRLTLVLLIAILYVVAAFGISSMDATFDPRKTFPTDSPLVESLRLVDDVYKQYAPVSFIINRPPNISDTNDYRHFMEMVETLEAIPESYGSERTLLWLRDYDVYYRKAMNISANSSTNGLLSYDFVPDFLDSKMMTDKNVVRFHYDKRHSVVVDSFAFLIVCRGESGWTKRAQLTEEIRGLLADYPTFNATLFNYDSTIFDLISTVKVEMAKAVLITIVCMMCVCFVFIPRFLSTLIATLSILSVSFSLLGLLGWWGLDMDPITMISVLMAIGFSVDFTAHICYHLHNYKHDNTTDYTDDRRVDMLASVFQSIASPMVEAASSTVLCMLPLFLIRVYTITSFAKTVCLVSALGTLHGLFILPSVLTLMRKRHEPYEKTVTQTTLIATESIVSCKSEQQPMI